MNTKENSNIDTIKDIATITYTKVYKDEFIFTTEKMVHYYCKIFLIWLECLYLAGMFICEMRDNN